MICKECGSWNMAKIWRHYQNRWGQLVSVWKCCDCGAGAEVPEDETPKAVKLRPPWPIFRKRTKWSVPHA